MVNNNAVNAVIKKMATYRPSLAVATIKAIITNYASQTDPNPLGETDQDVWWAYLRSLAEAETKAEGPSELCESCNEQPGTTNSQYIGINPDADHEEGAWVCLDCEQAAEAERQEFMEWLTQGLKY